MKKTLIALFAFCAVSITSFADTVFITGCTQPSGLTANADGSYTELVAFSGGTSAFSTADGSPPRTASRYKALSGFTLGVPIVRLTPTLGTPGGVYRVYYTHSSTANNTVSNTIIGFTNTANCNLSFTQTDAFQRKFGQPAPQSFIYLGNLTNDPGSSTPTFELFVKTTNDVATLRLLFDCMKFVLDEPCLNTASVGVTGPLAANLSTVVVSKVATNATQLNVYQNSGAGMTLIGTKSSGIVGGLESVAVTGLVKGAQVAATQVIGGQEGCIPTAGTIVGGGANPSVRMAFTIRETTSSGPIGAAATDNSSTLLHFMGASTVSGGAPVDAPVVSPSNDWQTFSLQRTGDRIGDSSNVVGSATAGTGYVTNNSVKIRVFAYKSFDFLTNVYSVLPAESVVVSSNDNFQAEWSWAPVDGVDGYRLLRSLNSGGYTQFVDVVNATTFVDNNTQWALGSNVFKKLNQTSPSIQWSPSVGNQNNIGGQWGILESINFAIDDLSDTGPFNIYLDNLQNGSTVFQDFENALSGASDFGFRLPLFSGTTSANLLPNPNIGFVTNIVADTGNKSFNVGFQWNGLVNSKWLRLTTSGVGTTNGTGNPLVNLDLPISVRILMLPVGGTLPAPPAPPAAPTLNIEKVGTNVIVSWAGVFRLLEATNVAGPYTVNGIIRSPYTNKAATATKFYRLKD